MLNDITNEISAWEPKFLKLAELFLQAASVPSTAFPGVTQGGASSLGTPTGSRVTLTMQPTQKPLVTTQPPKRKCNLKSISLYKQLILWDFRFKPLNCSK